MTSSGAGGLIPIRSLNTAVYPQQLLTGFATIWNGLNVAQVTLPQANIERVLIRVVLTTSLTVADMVSTQYWSPDPGNGLPTQAPFYIFAGAPAMSNIQDLTQIGNINVGEWFNPIRIQPNTDFYGLWLGVLAASASKCLASFYCEVY